MQIRIETALRVAANGYTGQLDITTSTGSHYRLPITQFHSCKYSKRAAVSEAIAELEKAIMEARSRYDIVGSEHLELCEKESGK